MSGRQRFTDRQTAVFHGPIHLDAAAAAATRAREVRCVCARSPFCTGPAGASFWDCDLRCKACRLPP